LNVLAVTATVSANIIAKGNTTPADLSASIVFVVLRCPSGGHLEASALWRYRLTQASSSQLPCKHGSKLSLDHHRRYGIWRF